MGRKELLVLVGDIARIVFLDGKEMGSEEKVIRMRSLLIDALTEKENGMDAPLKFGAE